MPDVTSASPRSTFQPKGSFKITAAEMADKPGTNAVIMVERTGPKCWIIFVNVMPEITT